MTTFEGKFIGKDVKITIVVARFNEFIYLEIIRWSNGRLDS